jgi:dCTP deaminase
MEDTMNKGVFSQAGLRALFQNNRLISGETFKESHIGPASVDLAMTSEIYEVNEMFLPKKGMTIRQTLKEVRHTPIGIGDVLYPGRKYLSKASVSVNFPRGVYGYANAKSTTGRNFIMVRAMADYCLSYDSMDSRHTGLSGEVWLLVEPLVFPVVATVDECLSQMRVFNGDTRIHSEVGLEKFLLGHDLLYRTDGSPYNQGDLDLGTNSGVFLMTLEAETEGVIGYQAKSVDTALDLTARGLDAREYFDPVYAEKVGNIYIVRLLPGRYYLLTSHEQVKIPVTHSVEMKAIDPRYGHFFSHFAGYFDPGFFGTATLEVMSPFGECVRHGQPVAAFELEMMQVETVSYGDVGNYAGQIGTRLPKQFKDWNT